MNVDTNENQQLYYRLSGHLDYKIVGKNIRKELKERNWEQREMAIVLKITEATFSKYISGRRRIPMDVAARIADECSIKLDRLLEGARI